MKAVLQFLMIILLLGCNPSESSRTILFLGDSLTEGDGVDGALTFTALVGENPKSFHSINQGRSGWSTEAYLRRWEEVEAAFPTERVDVILIQLGANDLRVFGHAEATALECKKNMEIIIARLRSAFPEAIICLMSSPKLDSNMLSDPIIEAGFGQHSNTYLGLIRDHYEKLAGEFEIKFLDLYNQLSVDGHTLDGAHLNEKGHRMAAVIILDYIETLFYQGSCCHE